MTMGMILFATAAQAAGWQDLPLETAVPPMLFVCTPQGESRPTFRQPWWQLQIARTGAVNKVRFYQIGEGHAPDHVLLENALTAYQVLREPGRTTWRISYARGRQSLTVEYFDPPEEHHNLRFVWRRPQGVMTGRCLQAPTPRQGWELREEAWR